ncbi:hypothetical protein NX059_001206 [Plenodomus lindquistii]|nr:hypothetical protein NX059_001206 [Plenodomus lindquistii]
MSEPVDLSVSLPADVYEADWIVRELIREFLGSLNRDLSEILIQEQTEIVLSTVSGDLVKLHSFVQVLQNRVNSISWAWATSVFVEVYNLRLEKVDEPDLEGPEIAVAYLMEEINALFVSECWNREARNSLDLVRQLLQETTTRAAELTHVLACGLISNMAGSFNLYLYDNLTVFLDFADDVIPHLDRAAPSGKSSRVNAMFHKLKNMEFQRRSKEDRQVKAFFRRHGREKLDLVEAGLSLAHTTTCQPCYETTVQQHAQIAAFLSHHAGIYIEDDRPKPATQEVPSSAWSELFEGDWECPELTRLITHTMQITKMGAPLAALSMAFDLIERMIASVRLSYLNNLRVFISFVFNIGPTLDSMVTPSTSKRLTDLFVKLHQKPMVSSDRRQVKQLIRAFRSSIVEYVSFRTADGEEDDGYLID